MMIIHKLCRNASHSYIYINGEVPLWECGSFRQFLKYKFLISHQEFGKIQLDKIQLLAKYNTSINNNQVRYFYLTL